LTTSGARDANLLRSGSFFIKRSSAAASAPTLLFFTTSPSISWRTIRSTAGPASSAITGTPQAIASQIPLPNPSTHEAETKM
jgi:hypothetical protein